MIKDMKTGIDDAPCSACGKKVSTNCMFISLGLAGNRDVPAHRMEGLEESSGPYWHGGPYHICYECALKALNVPIPTREAE